MSGLRFCFLTTFYPPYNFGGDGIGIQRLARGLVKAGHQVTVIHDVDAYRALDAGRARSEPPEPEGLEVVRLRSRLGALAPLLTYLTGRPLVHGATLRGVLARGRFDVVHFNNVSLVGGPGLLAYGGGVKLYEAHEHWLVCPAHVLWRHNREACTGRECLRCVLHYGRPPQPWRYTGLLERRLGDIDAFIEAGQLEGILDAKLVEERVFGEIGDMDDDIAAQRAEFLRARAARGAPRQVRVHLDALGGLQAAVEERHQSRFHPFAVHFSLLSSL